MTNATYQVSWRGQQSGPFTREEIVTQLLRGEISGMHLVYDAGAWIPVEEFLTPGADTPPLLPARPRATRKLDPPGMDERHADAALDSSPRPAPPHFAPPSPQPAPQWVAAYQQQRVSALAVVAFIFSLTSWAFLFLWPLAAAIWLLSIIFGHTASSECLRKPNLGGRGLAIAALAISYLSLLLFVALVFVLRYELIHHV